MIARRSAPRSRWFAAVADDLVATDPALRGHRRRLRDAAVLEPAARVPVVGPAHPRAAGVPRSGAAAYRRLRERVRTVIRPRCWVAPRRSSGPTASPARSIGTCRRWPPRWRTVRSTSMRSGDGRRRRAARSSSPSPASGHGPPTSTCWRAWVDPTSGPSATGRFRSRWARPSDWRSRPTLRRWRGSGTGGVLIARPRPGSCGTATWAARASRDPGRSPRRPLIRRVRHVLRTHSTQSIVCFQRLK